MSTLGIDLGTGSVKAAIVDSDGVIVAKQSQAYAVRAPQPGWAESDPREWLEAARAVTTRVLGDGGDGTRAVTTRVTGAGFSGQMHGVVVTGADLVPLRPAILWADGRSVPQVQALAADLTAGELSRLGSPAVTGFAATTLAWLLANEPDVMARAAHVLQPKDWLRAALGGELATEPSDASGTLLFDVAEGTWSARALEWLGLDPALLPEVRGSADAAGSIRVDGGPALPCVVGGADTACALAGLGLATGDGFLAVGSGAQVVRVMADAHLDATLRTHTFATVGAPLAGWYRIGAVQSSGLSLTAALGWLDADVAEAAAALAEGIRPDDPIFVPYLSGERTPFMDPSLRGSWHGLSLATGRSAMLRSVLEGVAQAAALGVEAVQESGAPLPAVVPLVGGGTHDPAFRQLLADASGLSLAVTDAPDAAVVGAALLARGLDSNPRPPVRTSVVHPDPAAVSLLRHRRERMVALATARGGRQTGAS
jgi:xylulokinase